MFPMATFMLALVAADVPSPGQLLAALESNYSAVTSVAATVHVENLQPTGAMRTFTVNWYVKGDKVKFTGTCSSGAANSVEFAFNGFHSKEIIGEAVGRISTRDRSSLQPMYIYSDPLFLPYKAVTGGVRHASFRPAFDAGAVNMTVNGEEQVGPYSCVVLEATSKRSGRTFAKWWLDPGVDYQPRKIWTEDLRNTVQDIEYIRIASVWMPVSGRVVYAPNPQTGVASYWAVTIDPASLQVNGDIDESVFDVTFPPDMKVYDEIAGQWGVVATSYDDFLAREALALRKTLDKDPHITRFCANDIARPRSTWRSSVGAMLICLVLGFSGFRLLAGRPRRGGNP